MGWDNDICHWLVQSLGLNCGYQTPLYYALAVTHEACYSCYECNKAVEVIWSGEVWTLTLVTHLAVIRVSLFIPTGKHLISHILNSHEVRFRSRLSVKNMIHTLWHWPRVWPPMDKDFRFESISRLLSDKSDLNLGLTFPTVKLMCKTRVL